MNPVDQPGTTPVPGLGEMERINSAAKPLPRPGDPPVRGAAALQRVDTLEKALVPIAAVGGAFLKPEGFVGKTAISFLTGFKVGEAAELGNKVGPSALMFLAPEPIGLLPERFFSGKPQIPGTGIYFDPVYNVKRQLEKRDADRREDVGSVQLKLLKELLPTLSTDEVRRLYLDQELRRRSITYVVPNVVDDVLQAELAKRQRQREQEDAAALAIARGGDRFSESAIAADAVAKFLGGDPYLIAGLGDQIPDAAARQERSSMRRIKVLAERAALDERIAETAELGLNAFFGLQALDALQAVMPPDP